MATRETDRTLATMHADITALHARISQQEREIATLRTAGGAGKSAQSGTSRRTLLKQLALGAAGVAAASGALGKAATDVSATTGSDPTIGFYAIPASFPADGSTVPTGSEIGLLGSSSTNLGGGSGITAGVVGVSDTSGGGGIGVLGKSLFGGTGLYGTTVGTRFGANAVYGLNSSNANGGAGVKGETSTGSSTNAVYGLNSSGGSTLVGVRGEVSSAGQDGIGVYGIASTALASIGVQGEGKTVGMIGKGTTTIASGVIGLTSGLSPSAVIAAGTVGNSNQAAMPGVYGNHTAGGIGVRGASATGHGVSGSTSGTGLVAGLYGTSTTAYGIIGNTTAPFYSGLTATTATTNCAALAATSTNASAFAAYFKGFTYVEGSFAVSGNKSAAVMHPDGTRRLLYCVESPEAWFEDFGEAKLVGGKAEVRLDPDFAALIETGTYHVFPVSHDPASKGLAVSERHKDGFIVAEHGGGASSGTFSWRIVARRKDNPGKRLEKLNVPKFNLPDPDKLPKLEPPKNA